MKDFVNQHFQTQTNADAGQSEPGCGNNPQWKSEKSRPAPDIEILEVIGQPSKQSRFKRRSSDKINHSNIREKCSQTSQKMCEKRVSENGTHDEKSADTKRSFDSTYQTATKIYENNKKLKSDLKAHHDIKRSSASLKPLMDARLFDKQI